MKTYKTSFATKILVTLTFLIMIAANAAASIIPINGQNTGQISDSYPNLFAPAGVTFAIWGVIYLLLGGFVLYQWGIFQKASVVPNPHLLEKVGFIFSLSSVVNTAWIFSWHYRLIPLSVVLMLAILLCLIALSSTIRSANLVSRDRFFLSLPFSVYFGWITVATIANITTLLVDIGWDGFGIDQPTWTVTILAVGCLIGLLAMISNKDIAYGLVLVWAYGGILLKHTSITGFNGEYPTVITAVSISLALFVGAEIYLLLAGRKISK